MKCDSVCVVCRDGLRFSTTFIFCVCGCGWYLFVGAHTCAFCLWPLQVGFCTLWSLCLGSIGVLFFVMVGSVWYILYARLILYIASSFQHL